MNNKLLNMILEEEEDAQYPQDYVFYADLWHPEQQGFLLSYDGNDYCSKDVANYRSGDSSGAIEVWFRSSSTVNTQMLFASNDTATANSVLCVRVQATTGFVQIISNNNG